MKICPACNQGNPPTATNCQLCSAPLIIDAPTAHTSVFERTILVCRKCNASNPPSAKFCSKCKEPLAPHQPPHSSSQLGTQLDMIDFQPPESCLQEDPDAPLLLQVRWSRVFLTGIQSQLWLCLQNRRADAAIENLKLVAYSHGFEETLDQTVKSINPGQEIQLLLTPTPGARAGLFALQFSLSFNIGSRRHEYVATHTNWINDSALPSEEIPRFAVNAGGGKIASSKTPRNALREIPGVFKVIKIISIDQLANLDLPTRFEEVGLCKAPKVSSRSDQVGNVLKLIPRSAAGGARAIHLVGRNQFRIGRSSKEGDQGPAADLIICYLPKTPANRDKTMQLGRLQVIAQCQDEQVILKNFQPAGSSRTYDSKLKGKPIGGGIPLEEGLLLLNSEYVIEVKRSQGLEGGRFWFEDPERGRAPSRPTGAVSFRPVRMELPFHDAVWIFSSAFFGSGSENPILMPNLDPNQGVFYFHGGRFLLQNLLRNGKVQVNGQPATPEELFPLTSNDTLRLAGVDYRLQVEME
jgi:ribosomal protein L40E